MESTVKEVVVLSETGKHLQELERQWIERLVAVFKAAGWEVLSYWSRLPGTDLDPDILVRVEGILYVVEVKRYEYAPTFLMLERAMQLVNRYAQLVQATLSEPIKAALLIPNDLNPEVLPILEAKGVQVPEVWGRKALQKMILEKSISPEHRKAAITLLYE